MRIRTIMILSLAFTFVCLMTACPNSKTVVKKISKRAEPQAGGMPSPTPRPSKLNGVFYALPRTVVKVTVPVKKTVSSPGRYSQFAAFFYPGEKFVTQQKTEFAPDKPTVETVGEVDPDEVYMIDIKSGVLQTKTLFLELSEDGLFSKARSEVTDQTPAFVGQIAKTAASIIGIPLSRKTVGSGNPFTVSEATNCSNLPDDDQAFCLALADTERDFYLKLNTQAKRAIYRSLDRRKSKEWKCYYDKLRRHYKLENPISEDEEKKCADLVTDEGLSQAEVYQEIYNPLPDGASADHKKYKQKLISDFNLAQITVVEIQDMLDQRALFVNGTSNGGLPPESFNAILKEIDNQIKAIKNDYFLGMKSTASDNIGPFEIVPKNVGSPTIARQLFVYSKSKGVLEIDNAFTAPEVIKKVKKGDFDAKLDAGGMAGLTDKVNVTIEFKPNQRPNEKQLAGIVSDGNFTQRGARGFRYRIPANYMVFVKDGNKEISDNLFPIAHLGLTVSLPASTGSWRTLYELALYQNTGALKNFTLGSDPLLQKSMIDDAEKAITTLTTATDDVTRLERQKKILELRQKIRELEEELANPD
jgi:hypothetical protein